ncbi:hypothetical protein NSK_000063 [Nannochloropsis salina CCMP1776]|uniref:50S ribosomal protein L19, chloroplastic n=1 Tax=Nannochloropsis salina CCMP1776 TaxID=1027361 RepID=A0A4D9DI21_9STRA|nr:hypothetical protein NSK_000063 [Nannochloropsis salina CCMP1776]|eukprot:TFJ88489.1 hypothetical protein NSK_000063 [Nannochloropsis salina CCMP1776]
MYTDGYESFEMAVDAIYVLSSSPKAIARASSVLAELRRIEHSKSISANAAKNFPSFRAGDSIEVKMVTHLSSTEIDTYRGVVLGLRRNGADSRFLLADVFLGTPILNNIPLYSPFIKSFKVLQPAYIHKGKKRFFMAIATVAGTGVCLAHIRAKCARTAEGTNKYMRYSAYAAIPFLTFTGLASVAWKCIPTSAFYVFCTNAGCVKEDAEGIKAVGVYYVWIGNLSSTVLSFFLFLTLWRLSRYQDSDETEEVEIQLVDDQHNKQAIINARNKAYLVDGSGGIKPLQMGAKVSTPLSIRSPAEAWNPQSAQLPYTAVGKVQSGGFGSTQPSWLTGV